MQGRASKVAQAMGLQSTRAHHKQAQRRAAETHWAWRIAGCAECFQVSIMRRSSTVPVRPKANGTQKCSFLNTHSTRNMHKKLVSLLDLCVSSLRRGHANLLCIVPILVYILPKQVHHVLAKMTVHIGINPESIEVRDSGHRQSDTHLTIASVLVDCPKG